MTKKVQAYFGPANTNTGGGANFAPAQSNVGGSAYFGGAVPQHHSTGPHKSHGIGGFFSNATHEIEDMATGALPGAINTIRHPVRTVEAMGKLYAHNYAPLIHGDFGKFAHQVYENPVGYGMDFATLAVALGTAGLASPEMVAARTAFEAGEVTKGIKLANAAARAGQVGGRTIVKKVSRNPVIRARQLAVDRMIRRIPEKGGLEKIFSEDARFGRATRRDVYHESRRLRVMGYPFEKAWHRLNKEERVAFSYHADALHPTEEAAYLRDLHPDFDTNPQHELVKAAIARGEDPKIIDLFEKPSKRLEAALLEGRALSKRLEEDKVAKGMREPSLEKRRPEGSPLPEDAFAERPFLHLRMVRGAQFEHVPGESASLGRARDYVDRLQKVYDKQVARVSSAQQKLILTEADKYMPESLGGKPVRPGPERVRPRTVEDARARFAELDKSYQATIAALSEKLGHPAGLSEKQLSKDAMDIGKRNAKADRQAKGVTKNGKRSGASGPKVKKQKLPKQVMHDYAEAELERVIRADTENPGILRLRELVDERDELQRKLEAHEEQSAFGGESIEAKVQAVKDEPTSWDYHTGRPQLTSAASQKIADIHAGKDRPDFGTMKVPPKVRKPATVLKGDVTDFSAQPLGAKVLTHDDRLLTPKGGARGERLGAALSVAKDKLEQAEARALVRQVRDDPTSWDAGKLTAAAEKKIKEIREGSKEHGVKPARGARDQMVLKGGPDIEALKAEGRDPFYVPDLVKSKPPSDRTGGLGRGVPKPDQSLNQNIATLFDRGQLYRDPEALHIGHLRQVRSQLATSIHNALVDNGVRMHKGDILPHGYEYIRRDAGQTISYTQRSRTAALEELTQERHFTTNTLEDAASVDGEYIAVPKAYADKLTGEFTKSGHAFAALWEKPTKVWRAMVLGLRPGFFTNNVVGNYLLYGLRHHDWDSVAAWITFLKETKATKALDELGQDVTFRKLAMEHIPEVFYGTFGRTAFEDLPGIGKLGRFRQGVGPVTVKVAEEHPRLMVAREVVIKEARKLKIKIPSQTNEFNALADEMLRKPGVAARAVEEANTTLGDYLHYSPAEEHIRNLIPFYGWIRAITKIALNTTLDTPGRTLLIARLGELAVAENESKYGPLPDYLRGLIPLSGGKGTVTAVTTRGLNPASTVGDVVGGVGGILSGKPGEGAKAIAKLGPHPFLQALYEWASGKSMAYGGKVHPTLLPGLPGYVLGSIGGNLPEVTLAKTLAGHSRPSKVYANNASRLAALGTISGVPVKKINLRAANTSARLPGR